MKPKKHHYVYEISYPNNMKYIGVRSCDCEIEDDPYMGSAKHIPKELRGTGTKKVLSIHTDRLSAMNEEIRLHAELDVKNNPEYYNQCNSSSTKFMISQEAAKRSGETRKGRTKETHEYIERQVKARAKYKGDNRTEAQKAQFDPETMPARMEKYKATLAETLKDPVRKAQIEDARRRGGLWGKGKSNPKKSNPGLKHGMARPWYYTTPDGITVHVLNSVRGYLKDPNRELTFSEWQIGECLRGAMPQWIKEAGWQFGYIADRPNESVEQ